MPQKQFGLIDAFVIKVCMALFMVLDHLYYYLPSMPEWFTWLGRIVAPVFCYLMTQGMIYTSHRRNYIMRLWLAGGVMFAGNLILYSFFLKNASLSLLLARAFMPNIFFSLAVTASLIAGIDQLRQGFVSMPIVVTVLLLAMTSTATEGGILIPAIGLTFYYLRQNRSVMCVAYTIVVCAIVPILWQSSFPQILMIGAVIPILLYNGKRGNNSNFAKKFFYIFYPTHIWAIFILRQLFFD